MPRKKADKTGIVDVLFARLINGWLSQLLIWLKNEYILIPHLLQSLLSEWRQLRNCEAGQIQRPE
ncbi:hypothetical protein B4135_0376 [Caldibacillus debilis]|uniref:Uncharacterized protein n=1 Tax=Caldibacillus debilis TaxID=301148 RepID=A0A150LKB0_9BACI|nr:hypothetical protein B4135_0376 [Caldibacillus debilis]